MEVRGISMKQGNQFYLEIQIEDENNNLLDISSVSKVQFNIKDLTKTYDGTSQEVTYDVNKNCFLIWLTENETFKFTKSIKIDARILFKNNTIQETYIESFNWQYSLKTEALDVQIKDIK